MKRSIHKVRVAMTAVMVLTVFCFAAIATGAKLQTAGEREEEIKKLVVMINAKLAGGPSYGAGIIFGIKADSLYITTANHVVRRGTMEAEGIEIRFRWLPDRDVKARLLQDCDSEIDMAVLEVTGLRGLAIDADTLPFDRLANLNMLQRGADLYLLGNPGGQSQWRINITPEKYNDTSKGVLEFESNLIARGHSGGALLNGQRELLGMLRRDNPPHGEAVSVTRIISKLKEWGYPVNLHAPLPQISAGEQRTCWVASDGVAKCMGDINQTATSHGVRFRSISVGGSHICGVAFNGHAYCMGLNRYGQLGRGSKDDNYLALARVQGGITFASVSAGAAHSCGLDPNGRAYCWGAGGQGRLGNDSNDESLVPLAVSGGLTFKMISAGRWNTCGLTADGAAYCWGGVGGTGRPRYGQDPPIAFVPTLVPGGLTFKTISAGLFYVCGVTGGGAAYCWGSNEYGQLGNDSDKDSMTPVPVPGRLTFKSVSVSMVSHVCGITTKGAAYCWGANDYGQLGNGTKKDSHVPVPVSGGLTFTSISAGSFHTCGVTTDGSTYCWGAEGMAGNGTGTKTGSSVPVRVPSLP